MILIMTYVKLLLLMLLIVPLYEVMKNSNNSQNHGYLKTGNCVLLEGEGDLDRYSCVEKFKSSCPSEPYLDDEIYKCGQSLSKKKNQMNILMFLRSIDNYTILFYLDKNNYCVRCFI